jgi:hypothetical protein
MRSEDQVIIGDQAYAQIKRGSGAWAYFYFVLGIVIAIEIAVVAMMPLAFPKNTFTLLAIVGLTIWAFVASEWLHDQLITLKTRYEKEGSIDACSRRSRAVGALTAPTRRRPARNPARIRRKISHPDTPSLDGSCSSQTHPT